MNEITRNVILDLLPLYLEGEASEDTSRLVQNYLKTDHELAEVVKQETEFNFEEVPIPLNQEKTMEKFNQTKKWLMTRTVLLNAIMALSFIIIFGCMFATILLSRFMEVFGDKFLNF